MGDGGWIGAAGRWRLAQTLVVLAALVPAALVVADFLRDNLGANPIEEITHRTGDWAIRLLLGALAVTPLRRFTGFNPVIRLRRTLGLLAFGYASLHFLTYAILDQGLFLQDGVLGFVAEDVMKRPYITVGFTAFVLLVPLAVTSTKGWIRRLGKRWTALHRLVYVAAALGVLHYLWLVKGEQATPVWYALILVTLLVMRVWAGRRSPAADRPSVNPPPPALPSPEAARPAPTPAAAPRPP